MRGERKACKALEGWEATRKHLGDKARLGSLLGDFRQGPLAKSDFGYFQGAPGCLFICVENNLYGGGYRVEEGRLLPSEVTGASTGCKWDDEFSACLVVKVHGFIGGLNAEVRQREEPRDISLRV